jgi:hypothetical protein
VTLETGGALVSAKKAVVGPFVVELDSTPTRDLVTSQAILLHHEPSKRFLVGILMADGALGRWKCVSTNDSAARSTRSSCRELSPSLDLSRVERDMAGIASYRKVSSLERIFGLLMCTQGESRLTESFEIVTGITLPPQGTTSKLTQMVVCMAIGAVLEGSQGNRQPFPMTALTFRSSVSTEKIETGATMVEGIDPHRLPAALGVALLTVRSQTPIVRIAMAVGTVGERNSRESNETRVVTLCICHRDTRMAPTASHQTVFPNKRISGFLMLELNAFGPFLESVAILAPPVGELPPMLVQVARHTLGPIQTEKRPAQVFPLSLKLLFRPDQLLLVTAPAGELAVRSTEIEGCLTVIEHFFALFTPIDELEIDTVMLHMTALTALVHHRGVKSPTPVQLFSEKLVTIQTTLGRDSLLLAVALQTLITTVEARVCRTQWTR